MPRHVAEILEGLLGSSVVAAAPVARGYTNNSRWLVGLADGRTAFIKQAVDEPTAAGVDAAKTATYNAP
jgi:hypothetical protein